ncbi:hypothetical protein H6F76_03060 [Leptolyngbya sp. FACHB-321]|uniref:hypothetical protein n=1 Tax=Leptolyngbya sp. FACHB-321 TaxID=2692807 RepID=UPI0016894C36|nr:hypothetical protein [Leptolyngbya sp. FACHB-321]MBD2034030.1 hypothetical protein [Leptolyngbya sp. FACHB-321]
MNATQAEASPLDVTLGQIRRLPCKFIKGKSDTQPIILKTIAQELAGTGKNILPVVVRLVGEDKYQAILNTQILDAARLIHLDFVWCIVVNQAMQTQVEVELGQTLWVNLTTASEQDLADTLTYLASQPGSPLKGLEATTAASKIAAEDRCTWQDFTPIIKLKCGITKGKKLDALATAFYLTPPPPLPAPPAAISIKQATRAAIFERLAYLTSHKLSGFGTVDPEAVSDLIASVDRSKWKSLTPITKLGCGIDTAKLKALKTLFTL